MKKRTDEKDRFALFIFLHPIFLVRQGSVKSSYRGLTSDVSGFCARFNLGPEPRDSLTDRRSPRARRGPFRTFDASVPRATTLRIARMTSIR